MIKTVGLKFNYPKGQSFEFPDISVQSSENFLITGSSGVGKTTLLHLLSGIIRPSEGQIFIDNQDITKLSNKQLDRFRGQHIGLVLQQNHFIASLDVLDNLLMTSYLSGSKKDKNKALNLLTSLEIDTLKNKMTYELSVGQQQRLSIARALMNEPKLILADEPTSSLDDQNTKKVIELLQKLSDEFQVALVVVTHDQRLKNIIKNGINLSN